jgi:hypothetical protein
LAEEIIESLEAGLASFRKILAGLEKAIGDESKKIGQPPDDGSQRG